MTEQGNPAAVSDRVLTLPNLLSVFRLVLIPVFGWAIVTHRDGLALGTLAVSGLSDYLDGQLARRWNQVTRLGQVLDPFADRLYIATTLLGLAYRGLIPWWLVVVLVARDALMAATVPFLAAVGHGVLRVHFLGKLGTFCLLSAFPLLLLSVVSETVSAPAHALGWAFALWGTGLYWWAGLLYLQQAVRVVRMEKAGATAQPGRPA